MNVKFSEEIDHLSTFQEGIQVLVGGGSDGASVNICCHNGVKKVQTLFSWLFWARCFSHRLKLACKDSFSSPLFMDINEILLCLYYLYKKVS